MSQPRPRGPVYDLHTHSLRSDGMLPPATVVSLAAEAGLTGLALTDHDTTAGWDEAAAACAAHGLEFVPGIELSSEHEGRAVHVLGYWLDGDDPGLVAECARLRGERDRRAMAMLARLAELGAGVSEERVRALAGDAPLGRPHIGAALIEAGLVADLEEAFDRYLADGRPAWEPKDSLPSADAVRLLRAAGGVAVLAHPGCSEVSLDLLDALAAAGLAGVEADHPGHDPRVVESWRRAARERDLVATGASDFHGGRKDVNIGERTTSESSLERLRARTSRTVPAGPRPSHPGSQGPQ